MRTLIFIMASFICLSEEAQPVADSVLQLYKEPYRPQIHFSPKAHWMNDPNGMAYHAGIYHLFYQYYPGGTTWGPMHWGHATTKDLVHWQEQPIALYPDKTGYIFSGSAVVDSLNTSGFGKNGKAPLVAIFTQHDMAGEKANTDTFQTQSIAWSNDNGKTWTKYSGNPVLHNPGIKDFRDPKVIWHAESKKWIMTLATKDRITFYASKNLKEWQKESEFGQAVGAHGGVWECPDLFPLYDGDKKQWVVTVSINPGAPNGGSGTQYFVGNFDGSRFITSQTEARWIDYGTDNYAGVTWSNTGNRKIFLGWMTNWNYAQVVPTAPWRSAMTIPRDLRLQKIGEQYYLASQPVPELMKLAKKLLIKNSVSGQLNGPEYFTITGNTAESFSFTISNANGEKVVAGFDKASSQFYIDRTASGKTDFENSFPGKHVAPRFATTAKTDVTIVVDAASIELFADNGLSVMTDIFFPEAPYTKVQLSSKDKTMQMQQYPLQSIWK